MSLIGITETVIRDITRDKFIEILQKTYKILGIIIDSSHDDIKKKIREVDLKARMEEIEGLFADLQGIEKIQSKQSIKIALNALHEIVEKLHSNLDSASMKIIDNSNSWFTYWKSVDFNNEIKEIETNEKLLTIRYNRVKDLLKIVW